jgi:indolepyruvate ferredoxin oxidoreductase alpha subunit
MMSRLIDPNEGMQYLLMGDEAIARGALEGGVKVASGYPGTPSSEIIENLAGIAKDMNIYVEWSANEKLAMEVAAAASFAGIRSMCVMKQNGVNVASDFLLHLAGSGTRGGMILVACDDPGALSSINEGESRYFARLVEIPLLEPGDFQEAKDLIVWAFEFSEELKSLVMVRSVTRMSHGSGNVRFGKLPTADVHAEFKCHGTMLDPVEGPIMSYPVDIKHTEQHKKLDRAKEIFEDCPFNTYRGPDKPELLLITSSACHLYSKEAISILGVEERVGLLKLATTWPLPPKLIKRTLSRTDKILVVEEVLPFLEENIKILAAEMASDVGIKTFYGKNDNTVPMVGELNPDIVVRALVQVLGVEYKILPDVYEKKIEGLPIKELPSRELIFCPGCPHRASFWSIHNALQMDGRKGFVCGDVGCYTMAMLPTGFDTAKTAHSMGSGSGLASGFGKLEQFGFDQPVVSVCGDSTFFHTAIPALVNGTHHNANMTVVVLDNKGTAMTGFQAHPGLNVDAMGNEAPGIEIEEVCRSLGATVEIRDPFDLEETQKTLNQLIEKDGLKVLILRQICALSPEKKVGKKYEVMVDEGICLGENCGCNRVCTRIFRCPGLVWDRQRGITRIDEVICAGCGVCADICPAGAIKKKEA